MIPEADFISKFPRGEKLHEIIRGDRQTVEVFEQGPDHVIKTNTNIVEAAGEIVAYAVLHLRKISGKIPVAMSSRTVSARFPYLGAITGLSALDRQGDPQLAKKIIDSMASEMILLHAYGIANIDVQVKNVLSVDGKSEWSWHDLNGVNVLPRVRQEAAPLRQVLQTFSEDVDVFRGAFAEIPIGSLNYCLEIIKDLGALKSSVANFELMLHDIDTRIAAGYKASSAEVEGWLGKIKALSELVIKHKFGAFEQARIDYRNYINRRYSDFLQDLQRSLKVAFRGNESTLQTSQGEIGGEINQLIRKVFGPTKKERRHEQWEQEDRQRMEQRSKEEQGHIPEYIKVARAGLEDIKRVVSLCDKFSPMIVLFTQEDKRYRETLGKVFQSLLSFDAEWEKYRGLPVTPALFGDNDIEYKRIVEVIAGYVRSSVGVIRKPKSVRAYEAPIPADFLNEIEGIAWHSFLRGVKKDWLELFDEGKRYGYQFPPRLQEDIFTAIKQAEKSDEADKLGVFGRKIDRIINDLFFKKV